MVSCSTLNEVDTLTLSFIYGFHRVCFSTQPFKHLLFTSPIHLLLNILSGPRPSTLQNDHIVILQRANFPNPIAYNDLTHKNCVF